MPIRGLLSEYGIVIGKGINQVRKNLPEILEDGENGLTASGRELFAERYDQLKELDRQIGEQDRRMERLAQQNELSRQVAVIGDQQARQPVFTDAADSRSPSGVEYDRAENRPLESLAEGAETTPGREYRGSRAGE